MQPVLKLSNVVKSFGSLHIIKEANLDVTLYEKHAIIGPNGAGKSTLFNLISGRLSPSSGEIRLKGKNISGLAPEKISRLGLGRSFQISNNFPQMTVFENVRIGVMARHHLRYGILRLASRLREINEETERLIESVLLQSRMNSRAGALTYSEQRALEIAVTLATDPVVLLLDEPTAGMSSDEAAQMVDLIRRVTAGRTLLVVEHDMNVVFGLCNRISVLVYGSFLASGTPEQIRSNTDVQRAYLGDIDT
jgi:branched-chain amino acid transport system ATP-binding protein